MSDLEGIRRAALLVAELRADGVTADEAAQRLPGSAILDPYTGHPFTWEDAGDAVVFQGLERHERSRHELIH